MKVGHVTLSKQTVPLPLRNTFRYTSEARG